MVSFYNESYINDYIYDVYASNRESFFTNVRPEEASSLWTKAEYEQNLNSFAWKMSFITAPSALTLVTSIAMAVAGIAFGSLAIAFLGAVGCTLTLYCCIPFFTDFGDYFFTKSFLNQVQLRTRLVWEHGMNNQNWPPHRGEVPAPISSLPIETQDALFDQYCNEFPENNARNALFAMALGQWQSPNVAEFLNKLNHQPAN